MNRRRFLSWLGAGVVAGVVAPAAVKASAPTLLGEEQCQYIPQSMSQYADYADFSAISLTSAIDAAVIESANELSYRIARSL
jgi:hypothetical protein